MRAPQLVSDFWDWRWAPCVGLTAGSLAFVALALLLIPTQFDAVPAAPSSNSLAALDRPSESAAARPLFGASLTRGVTGLAQRSTDEVVPNRGLSAPSPDSVAAASPRGFSPVLERPAPPPVVDVPPPEPPPPAPGTVIISQPEPGGPSREMTAQ